MPGNRKRREWSIEFVNKAPKDLGELAEYADHIPIERLASVWVALLIEPIEEISTLEARSEGDTRNLIRTMIVIAERLREHYEPDYQRVTDGQRKSPIWQPRP